jgi:predicted kinase
MSTPWDLFAARDDLCARDMRALADAMAAEPASDTAPELAAIVDPDTRAEIARHRRLIEARRVEVGDPLFGVAAPLVDLARIGRRDLANALLARYLQRRPDEAGLALLPLFQTLRAAARGEPDLARRYLAERPAPRLVAVGGLSGSGKSGVAAHIAPALGVAPGAVVLRSDVERKRLAGVAPEERLAQDAYTKHASEAVYDSLFARARAALTAGHSVVLDAVFADPAERARAGDLAARAGVRFDGFWLECPAELRAARTGARIDDASDAGPDVALWQSGLDLGLIDWTRLDASVGPSEIFAAARAAIEAGQSEAPRTGVI